MILTIPIEDGEEGTNLVQLVLHINSHITIQILKYHIVASGHCVVPFGHILLLLTNEYPCIGHQLVSTRLLRGISFD